MSLLTGPAIRQAIENGDIICDPAPEVIGPNSLDVTLGPTLLRYVSDCMILDSDEPNEVETVPPSHRKGMCQAWVLKPGELYLGSTRERVGSNVYAPMLEGRSSLARLGIQAHMTAGFGDLGFISQWTLEITVVRSTIIYETMRVGQICFHTVEGEVQLYDGKYQDQKGPVPSRLWRDGRNRL